MTLFADRPWLEASTGRGSELPISFAGPFGKPPSTFVIEHKLASVGALIKLGFTACTSQGA